MASLKIFWTSTAIKQRNFVFEYWNERNKSNTYSKKLLKNITERTVQLKKYPDIGKETNYKNHRSISLGHYSILYKKEIGKIIITAFWDNRQDRKKLLDYLKNS